ncbi:MAG: Yip1 family protein [Pseudorhodobacter sp.]|nr:Yip1 family protein [Pseudorhodobacter sp.]
MNQTLATLLALARLSLKHPRDGARQVIARHLPRSVGWLGLGLAAVLSTLLVHLSFAMQPADVKSFFAATIASPLRTALLQAGFMGVAVAAVTSIGRWRGGHGSFDGALILVVWLQFLLLGLQAVQLVAYAVAPLLADLIGLATVALFFWLLTNFIAELHGFKSLGLVFVGVLATLVVMVLGLAFGLALFVGA